MRIEVTYVDGEIVVRLPGVGLAIGREIKSAGWPLPTVLKGKVFLIEYITVAPQHEGNGYGSLLMERLLAEAKQRKIEHVLVYAKPMGHLKNTVKGMTKLISFYNRHGFQVIDKNRQHATMLLTQSI